MFSPLDLTVEVGVEPNTDRYIIIIMKVRESWRGGPNIFI